MTDRALIEYLLGWITGIALFCVATFAIKYLRYRRRPKDTHPRIVGEEGPRIRDGVGYGTSIDSFVPPLGANGPEMVAKCSNCGHSLTPTARCLSCGHLTRAA